jgi:predicted O-methyltransferase YrrM
MENLIELVEKNEYDLGGRCGDFKGDIIKNLVIKSNAKFCIEIGVFKGSSLMYFIEALKNTNGKIIGIDPYSHPAFKNHIESPYLYDAIYNRLFTEQKVLDDLYTDLIEKIKENNLNNIATIIRDSSENYYTNIERSSVDILHIDGNHDEKHVTMDILYYLPLVKKGGYVIMDDATWPGVKKSIDTYLIDMCDFLGYYPEQDFSIYIKK